MTDDTRAAPTPEATAPEPEFADLLNRYGMACYDHGRQGALPTEAAIEKRHALWQRITATVAALTAERGARETLQQDQNHLAETTKNQQLEPNLKGEG